MKIKLFFLIGMLTSLLACSNSYRDVSPAIDSVVLKGQWITEPNGQVMRDPQTSGLTHWNGQLMTLSDRSAHPSQRLRLRAIEAQGAKLTPQNMPMILAEHIKFGCFGDYLATNPDLEALVADPQESGVFFTITEDASSQGQLSGRCRQKYANTGSTDFPTLLVRLKIQDDGTVLMTNTRPVQFASSFMVGNFPNDGIEGLALGTDRTLYLALEKDSKSNARIFSTILTDDFWQTNDFIPLVDTEVKLPKFKQGNHPINGLDFYQYGEKSYLLAAARNDETLWIIDLTRSQETRIVSLVFQAPVMSTEGCEKWELMDNASIEGIAVVGKTLWLINDPWKKVYMQNVRCEQNRANYLMMAPLLFSLPIQGNWFE
ncbi:MAG: hypothetical protein ACJAUL_000055 [Paraglaciecola sp.]|jgi:hypothetical protein